MPNRNRSDMPDDYRLWPLASLRLAGAMADFAWYLLIFLARRLSQEEPFMGQSK